MEHITVNHYDTINSDIIEEIRNSLGPDAINKSRSQPTHFMAIEWLLLTAVFLHYTKPYFETLQKEAAKHHYEVLRKTTAKCWNRFFGKTPEYQFSRRDMKGEEIPSRFSFTFSIMADTDSRYQVKLLLDKALSQTEIQDASEAFLADMVAYHSNPGNGIVKQLEEKGIPAGGYFLVRYDVSSKTLKPVSAIPGSEDYPG